MLASGLKSIGLDQGKDAAVDYRAEASDPDPYPRVLRQQIVGVILMDASVIHPKFTYFGLTIDLPNDRLPRFIPIKRDG